MKYTAVIGLGNLLMRDEGIGVHLIRVLEPLADQFPNVAFEDCGTAGMAVIHAIRDTQKAVFIDCARMKTQPGTIKRLTRRDIASIKEMPGLSLHEGDLLGILDTAESLGTLPPRVVIFAIEPETVTPGDTLSRTLADNMQTYVQTITAELQTAL